MDSMEDLMKKLGWIAWCLTVIGWFLSPIISLLVNKIFTYLVFDTSKKLKELENEKIRELKKMLSAVEKQTVLRAAEDNPSQSDLKILDNMKMDLKSALYEAEDTLDLLDYRRIEKDLHHVDDDSDWVEKQLAAACTWIACCKGSWYGRWIDSTLAAVMNNAQSRIQQGQLVIQGWRHLDLFSIRRVINIAGAAVLQCTQSWYKQLGQLLRNSVLQCTQSSYQQLGQLFRRVILRRPSVLLPVSINSTPQSPYLESRGPVLVTADPPCRPLKEMVDEEEIGETQLERGEAEVIEEGEEGEKSEEIKEESCDVEEVGETLKQETEEESCDDEEVEETSGEEIQEDDEEAKEREPTHRLAEEMVDEKEIVEETLVVEQEAEIEEVEEIEDGEEGEMPEEIEEGCGEVGETLQEETEKGPTSSLILWYCARSMLTWFAKAYFYRDWSYGIIGIKSDKKDASAVESLVTITERISLKNQIKRIEYILDTSKKSDLLNDEKSSSGTTVMNSANESSSKQKEIDELSRDSGREVFGREKDRAEISRMLREAPEASASSSTSKPYSVIGIYGITGSGKTTLAQYVCDDEKKAGHFDPIMFIHVGKTFSVGAIFRDMLEQMTHSRPPNDEGLKSLKTKLEKTLKGKRFLLVLDDLWVNDDNRNEQDILLVMLSVALSGSRVLVTAQKTDAAEALGAHLQPFSIPDLEEEAYLSLLMHHAGPFADDHDYGEYERTGSKIAKRLRRSPIAAVTVGKRLQNKRLDFWKTTANLDVLNKTMGALWWSYQQLGVDVRRCFAYCSIFPSGYELERDELVRIWIAQGFVNNETEGLEDRGHHYFEELLTFSFLQVGRKTSFGKVLSSSRKTKILFTIHDLLHELAERVSGSDFFRIGLNDSPKDIPRGVHHLFIETTNGVEIAEKLVEVENLRTLIIKKRLADPLRRNHDSERLLERLFMRLTKLRVLIIKQNESVQKLSVPACIDRMKHLRYLGLHFHACFPDLILPSTFSKLYHIEVIDIPHVEASCPEDMANLIYLRHISGRWSFPNIGRLTALQTLKKFIVKEEPGNELKQLKHLSKLGGTLSIDGLGIVGSKEEALEAHLTHKEGLRRLELDFGWYWEKRFGPDVEAEVLEGLCPPKDLEELIIYVYKGSTYPSWMLSPQHPYAPQQLQKLQLSWHCSQLASIPKDSKLFIGLRELNIHDCNWDRLPQNMERLVSLQRLMISHCHKVEHLPTLPHQSLEEIGIHSCKVLSKTCKEKGHENWQKIKDIPKKDIW